MRFRERNNTQRRFYNNIVAGFSDHSIEMTISQRSVYNKIDETPTTMLKKSKFNRVQLNIKLMRLNQNRKLSRVRFTIIIRSDFGGKMPKHRNECEKISHNPSFSHQPTPIFASCFFDFPERRAETAIVSPL